MGLVGPDPLAPNLLIASERSPELWGYPEAVNAGRDFPKRCPFRLGPLQSVLAECVERGSR